MSYVVIYPRDVQAQLANLWSAASDRSAVSDSEARIFAELGQNPDAKGLPFGKYRMYYDSPLAVLYAVYPGDGIVIVLAFKRIQ